MNYNFIFSKRKKKTKKKNTNPQQSTINNAKSLSFHIPTQKYPYHGIIICTNIHLIIY